MKGVALAVLFLVVFPAFAWAQQPSETMDWPTVLSGEPIPLTMKLKDLDAGWRRITPVGGDGQAASYAFYYGLPTGMYYTRGGVVSISGESYMAAYAPPVSRGAMSFVLMGRQGGKLEEITGETALTLALLNVRTMGSVTDIRPFNLEAELAAFAEANTRLQSIMESRASVGVVEGVDDSSLSNLKNVALAAQMFMADYDDKIPPMDTPEAFREALAEYVSSDDVFADPDTGEDYAVNASLNGKTLAQIQDPSKIVLVYQPTAREDGTRGVAFLDGHAERVNEERWQELKSQSGLQ